MSLRATTPSAPRITAELQVGRETSSFVGQLAATGRAIPLLAGLLYLAVGVWLMLGVGYFVQDALSRTGNAMYVVFGRDPHLAALGFVWNPLPSLLQVPLVLVLDPLGLVYLAGPIISAAFGGATLWVFDRIYRLLGVAGRWRWALLLLYGLNPLVVVYAANGLSEGPFIFFLVASVYAYLRWVHGGGYSALMWFSFCTAGAFTVRYEAIPFAAVAIVVVIATFLASEKIDPPKLEATLLAFLIPIAYSIGLWLFFNWTIMGDPLHFQRSDYGNTAQTAVFRSSSSYLSEFIGSAPASLVYGLGHWIAIFPAVLPVTVAALIRGLWRRDVVLASLLGLSVSVILFHVYLLYSGSSFG